MPTNKPHEDVPFGFFDEDEDCSLIDGERACREVLSKVAPYIKDISKIEGSLPSCSSVLKTSVGLSSKDSVTIDGRRKALSQLKEWTEATDVIQ